MASPALLGLFDAFFRPWMRRQIAAVEITGATDLPDDPARPVLLCPNHVSWWDGFVARDVARLLRPDGSFHVVALERELRARPFLRLLGAVGLEPGSTGSLRALLRRVEALGEGDRRSVLTVFPQGRIWPAFRRPLDFRPGVALLRRALAPCWTVPVAIRVEPLANRRPTVFVSVAEPLGPAWPETDVVEALEARVVDELDALGHFLALHGEEAAEAWPGPRGRLPRALREPTLRRETPARGAIPRPSLN